MLNPVSTDAVASLVDSPPNPYSKALDILATTVGTRTGSTDRVKSLKQIALIVPEGAKELKGLVRALLALTRPTRRRRVRNPKVKQAGLCTLCKRQLPHKTWRDMSFHGHYARLVRARKHRWSKYPDPSDRRAQTELARTTILAARHSRWIAALRSWDSVRTEHLLRTQGPDAVIALFRSLSSYRRKRLLKQVPRPPKRKFKGESLVLKGLRPPKLHLRTKYLEHEKGTP